MTQKLTGWSQWLNNVVQIILPLLVTTSNLIIQQIKLSQRDSVIGIKKVGWQLNHYMVHIHLAYSLLMVVKLLQQRAICQSVLQLVLTTKFLQRLIVNIHSQLVSHQFHKCAKTTKKLFLKVHLFVSLRNQTHKKLLLLGY